MNLFKEPLTYGIYETRYFPQLFAGMLEMFTYVVNADFRKYYRNFQTILKIQIFTPLKSF
jgi:hypothetical protein